MINSLLHKQEVLLLGQKKHQWMEDGVFGEVVVQPVEEEARLELVQTLPQPMEELVVSENLVRIVTWMTVGETQNPVMGPVSMTTEQRIWMAIPAQTTMMTSPRTVAILTRADLMLLVSVVLVGDHINHQERRHQKSHISDILQVMMWSQ